MVESASFRYEEIDGPGGEIEVLRRRRIGHRTFHTSRPPRQTNAVGGMHFLHLVPSREIHDHTAGVALHGFRSGALYVNTTRERRVVKKILFPGQYELGLIGANAHLLVD